jgi:hypothetical protein
MFWPAVPLKVFAPLLVVLPLLVIWKEVFVLQEVRELEAWVVEARELLD